jgi:hypothetical protein
MQLLREVVERNCCSGEEALCRGVDVVTKGQPKSYKTGDHIRVNMHSGKIVDAVIKAVHDEFTDGPRYQVDFDKDKTALIREWQIVKE